MAILVSVGWLAVASCGGGASGPVTLGQVCDSTGASYCNRVMACQLATYADCISVFKDSCCGSDDSCGDTTTTMDATMLHEYESACDAAFSSQSCADVEAGTIPDACSTPP